jgi:hypothetical protein
MATPRKTRSHGPAEDIDLDHPAGGAEADAHLIGVHPPTRLEKEVSAAPDPFISCIMRQS